jgi:hypothetical protein
MPLAVLLPGILSQGRTTLRSLSPVRSHPRRAVATEVAPGSLVDARLTGQVAPLRSPDRSGTRRLASWPFTVGLPLSPLRPHLCSTSTARLFRADHGGALDAATRPQGLPPRTDPLYRCSVSTTPVPDASMGFVLCTHRPQGAGHLRGGTGSTGCSGFAASSASRSGATRGRRDAGHRAPRSVARRRGGPEG